MPLLAHLGNRASLLLHRLVYAFPAASPPAPSPTPASDASPNFDPAPAPEPTPALSFMGSGYGVTLILMGILLNRIHHTVRRPRQPPPDDHPRPQNPSYFYRLRASVSDFLTSPDAPRYIRLPGIVCLLRAWILFTVLLFQVIGLWPEFQHDGTTAMWRKATSRLGNWAGEMEMNDICWQVFVSVCVGLLCSGIANGLDTIRRRDVAASFNLTGYSFMMHLYSSPLTHQHTERAVAHGRPDAHAVFQLWLSLTELTWLQILELSLALRDNVLLPTSVCGVVGVVHFAYVLFSSPLRFPSFTFLTHMVSPTWYFLALFLSVVIFSTIILRAITFIFSYGYIPSLTSLLPHEGVIPDRRDDFGVTLLKIGTACIEATSLSGLKNELANIDKPKAPWVEITSDGSEFHHGPLQHSPTPGFCTEISNIKVSEAEDSERLNPQWREFRAFTRALFTAILSALIRFIMSTRIGRRMFRLGQKTWRARWWYGPRSWKFWRRDAWREPPENIRARERARLRARASAIMEQISGSGESSHPLPRTANLQRTGYTRGTSTSVSLRDHDGSTTTTIQRNRPPRREMWTYADYLLKDVDGEIEDDEEWIQEISDDPDSNSDSEQMSIADANEEGEEDLFDEGMDVEEEEVKQRGMLYGDLVSQTTENDGRQSSDDFQPVLLAHLTSRTAAPLTRQRYTSLMTLYSSDSLQTPTLPFLASMHNESALGLRDVMHERRQAMKGYEEDDEETKRTCVVCMVSMRDTILWPCRCLAVCNDCRESLAARLPAQNHMCPCCRKKVEGYSRIYIP
ncbi:hypothetical protein C368_06248 [Cryptococcus neoformans 125.91]|nr:hypothetical protein C368_06248 [Cryptococcus neoformans var. grubii 125.91]